jgi:hypothetical protein
VFEVEGCEFGDDVFEGSFGRDDAELGLYCHCRGFGDRWEAECGEIVGKLVVVTAVRGQSWSAWVAAMQKLLERRAQL